MLLVLRNGVKLVRLVRRTAGASVLRRSVGLAFGWHPFDFQIKTLREVRLRASRHCGQVLRSADIKADGGDGFHRRRTSSEGKANGHGWFHVESWRDPAHGRRRSWAFGERREAEGRALPAARSCSG
jgi:hypothetical protein